ncbi:hypothetical protein ACFVAD_00740 [Sutcliffiella sp. NPDC057660]|uniref:hypothetical protein n=1 Tax=Sutcliffiella sp. NPDC057660 TaxID=3346199 RepID=UPI0036B164E7
MVDRMYPSIEKLSDESLKAIAGTIMNMGLKQERIIRRSQYASNKKLVSSQSLDLFNFRMFCWRLKRHSFIKGLIFSVTVVIVIPIAPLI